MPTVGAGPRERWGNEMHTKVDFVHLTHEKLLNHQIYYISNIYQYPPKRYFVWNIFWPPNIFALLVVVAGVVPVSGCRSGQRWVRAAAGGGNLSNMWRQETCCAELWPELLSVTHRASWCYLHRSAACSQSLKTVLNAYNSLTPFTTHILEAIKTN